MIKTVTMNPAVDKTVEIDDFRIDAVNRISAVRIDAGGKGINVSKTIRALNGESIATGILAGSNGEYIRSYLVRMGIENDFLFVKGETRTNLKVVDRLRGTNTDINEPGVEVTGRDIEMLEDKIFSGINQGDILVLSGSIPATVPKDIYRKWTERAKKQGARVLLDADGELLQEGIKAAPYLVKPNINELERLMGRKLEKIDEVTGAAGSLLELGIEIVAVSLGEAGAVFVKKDKVIHAEGIAVDVISTVGAGDSMVASLAYALEEGYPFERAVTLSVAAGTASVATSGTQPPELEAVLSYEKQVRYTIL